LLLRRAALAPVCLLLIVGLHAYRVIAFDQSRWKGGGFGMFSTVDAESSRFLKIYLTFADGRTVPVPLPDAFRKRGDTLRVLPSPAVAQELADRLLKLRWRRQSTERQQEAHTGNARPKDHVWSTADLHPAEESVDEPLTIGIPSDYAPVAAGAHASQGSAPIAVRVEVWRQRYDGQQQQLIASPILSVERTAEGTP
jgi:hypothetical protein